MQRERAAETEDTLKSGIPVGGLGYRRSTQPTIGPERGKERGRKRKREKERGERKIEAV